MIPPRFSPLRFAALALAGCIATCAVPASAQSSTSITEGSLSGTASFTRTANTDNEVDKLSGTQNGEWVEVTRECTNTYDAGGNSTKTTYKYTETHYDKKGGKQLSRRVYAYTDTYNAAGGFDEVATTNTINYGTGETVDETTKSSFDADGNRQSGDSEKTTRKPGEPPKTEKQHFDGPGPYGWKPLDHPESSLEPVRPDDAATTTPNESVYLPAVAGPSSQMVATFDDPTTAGPTVVIVGTIGQDGATKYYRTQTDPDKHLVISVASGIAAILLFKGFDHGKPDAAAARCTIASNATVPGTDALPKVPQDQVAITRAASAYERDGPGKGVFELQTRGTDPLHTRLLLDDRPRHIHVLAASNEEVKGRIGNSAKLGRHTISVVSGTQKSNVFPADLVTLHADPLPPSQVGVVEPLTVHVVGLPASDAATMSFAIGGAATLADGGTTATVPVTNGLAQVRVRGIRTGPALVRYHLHAKIAGFWDN